jgi:hypothetical protein
VEGCHFDFHECGAIYGTIACVKKRLLKFQGADQSLKDLKRRGGGSEVEKRKIVYLGHW